MKEILKLLKMMSACVAGATSSGVAGVQRLFGHRTASLRAVAGNFNNDLWLVTRNFDLSCGSLTIILNLSLLQELSCVWSHQGCPNRIISPWATGHPKEYTITHFAGGAMLNYFTSTFSSSCSVPIWTSIFGTKKQQNQNNQFISNQLSQTNIVLSKINFQCELLCSYCLHKFI